MKVISMNSRNHVRVIRFKSYEIEIDENIMYDPDPKLFGFNVYTLVVEVRYDLFLKKLFTYLITVDEDQAEDFITVLKLCYDDIRDLSY